MPSTSHHLEVSLDPLAVASDIQTDYLNERVGLPKAMNGSPIPCSDPRAISLRKKIQQGTCAPVRHMLLISKCDLRDGVALERVIAPYQRIIEFLHLCANPVRPRDLALLHTDETKAEGELNVAQLKVRETPDDPSALRAVIAASIKYESAHAALRRHYETRLLIAVGSTQRPMRIAQ